MAALSCAARWLLSWVAEAPEPSLEEWESRNLYLIPRSSSRPELPQLPAPLEVSHGVALPQTRPRLPALHNTFQSTYGRFGKSTPPRLPPAIEHYEEESAAMQEKDEGSNRGLKRALSSSGALGEPKRRSLDADKRPPTRRPPPYSRLQSCSDSGGRQWQLRTVHMQRCASEGDERYRSIESRHALQNTERQLTSGEAARVNSSPELQLLLDDTVQLLQPPLLGPPGPRTAAIQEAGVATVRALSDSLAAVVAAADGSAPEACAGPALAAETAGAEHYTAAAAES